MRQVKQIHGYTLRNGIYQTKILIEKLLEIPNLDYAHKKFKHYTIYNIQYHTLYNTNQKSLKTKFQTNINFLK